MATDIVEQIAVKAKTRLGLISETNSYETTVSEVVRPTRLGGFRPKNYQLIFETGDVVPAPEHNCTGNPPAQGFLLPLIIAATIRDSETNPVPRGTLKNTFRADVIKAIAAGDDWHNWDQLAINSDIGPTTDYAADDGSGHGFQLVVNVFYRTDENNPYNGRA